MTSSRALPRRRLRDHASGPAAASAAFPTSPGRYGAYPSFPQQSRYVRTHYFREEPDWNPILPGLIILGSRHRPHRLTTGNFGHRPGYVFRLIFQRQVSQRHDADHSPIFIHNGYAPDLVLLHQALAIIHVLALAAHSRIQADKFLDGSSLRIKSIGHHRATQISIGDDSDELARLVVGHHQY